MHGFFHNGHHPDGVDPKHLVISVERFYGVLFCVKDLSRISIFNELLQAVIFDFSCRMLINFEYSSHVIEPENSFRYWQSELYLLVNQESDRSRYKDRSKTSTQTAIVFFVVTS